MVNGLVDADLGGGVVKKHVALPGRGKRGGARILVAIDKGTVHEKQNPRGGAAIGSFPRWGKAGMGILEQGRRPFPSPPPAGEGARRFSANACPGHGLGLLSETVNI